MAQLLPVSPDWTAPSLIWPHARFGICANGDGKYYFCVLQDEKKGWEILNEATEVDIGAMENCQRLAGKNLAPLPR